MGVSKLKPTMSADQLAVASKKRKKEAEAVRLAAKARAEADGVATHVSTEKSRTKSYAKSLQCDKEAAREKQKARTKAMFAQSHAEDAGYGHGAVVDVAVTVDDSDVTPVAPAATTKPQTVPAVAVTDSDDEEIL
jgi:hypothetical protein